MIKTKFMQKEGVWKCAISTLAGLMFLSIQITGRGTKARTHTNTEIAQVGASLAPGKHGARMHCALQALVTHLFGECAISA